MGHQPVAILSLLFVHTARRSYRLGCEVSRLDPRLAVNPWQRGRLREKGSEPYGLEEGEVVTRYP